LQIELLAKKLRSNGIELEIDDTAVDWIANAGFDPQYGARPVKRIIQRNVMNELSKLILAGEINRDDKISIAAADNELKFTSHPAKALLAD